MNLSQKCIKLSTALNLHRIDELEKMSEQDFLTPLRIHRAKPVSTQCIVLYGSRTAGKDAITDALKNQIGTEVEKVECHAVYRSKRQGEELGTATGINTDMDLSDLEKNQEGFLLAYAAGGVFYAVPPDEFAGISHVPVLHVVGLNGLEGLVTEGTLPNRLDILVTINPESMDLERRVINRLTKYTDLPSDFDITNVTDDQKRLIQESLASTKQTITEFENQSIIEYHAVFDNSFPLDDDIRALIYKTQPIAFATEDIARRIHALYDMFTRELGDEKKIEGRSPAYMHNRQVTNWCKYIFGKGPKKIKRKNIFSQDFTKGTVTEYATSHDLTSEGIRVIFENVSVNEVTRSGTTGRVSIYLSREDDARVLVRDIGNEIYNGTYHTLMIIAKGMETRFGLRPKFDVVDGELIGLRYSLTDRKPDSDKKNKYYELFIGYG